MNRIVRKYKKRNNELINNNELFDLYINKKKTLVEVANILNFSTSKIRRYLIKYKIPIRNVGNNFKTRFIINDDIIRDLYVNKHMSSTEIAKEIGVSSHNTILRHLKKMNIERRKNWNNTEETISKIRKPKSEEAKENMRKPKSEEGVKNITIARRKQASEGRIEIANRLRGKTFEEVFGKEKALEIKDKIRKKMIGRKYPKQSILMTGDKNPAWNNGSSFEPYSREFNRKFKRKIIDRDNGVCMVCGIHKEKLNIPLHIHHINYNKQLSIEQNCISLCTSCHTKTNFNRKHWIKFFQSLLSERYEYKYSENGELMININELEK